MLTLWAGLRHIDGTLPYPEHIDERIVMLGAERVLANGDFNPQVYSYPSLPIYLNAVGLALGLIAASGDGPRHIAVNQIGRTGPPAYEQMRVVAVSRKLWVAMGMICLAATAAIAYRIAGPAAMLFTALVLGLAGVPGGLARSYVGVDVPMAMFVTLTLSCLLAPRDGERYRDLVWQPAALCGAAMACKFTAFILVLPCVIAIGLNSSRDRISRSLEFLAIALGVFLLLTPRFLIDLASFVDGLSFENFHYRVRGHKRFIIEPGWPQLVAYTGDIRAAFGSVVPSMSLLGALVLARARPRAAAVLLPFAFLWLYFLIGYKVHFTRNLLPVMLLVPVFAAVGGLALVRALAWGLQRHPRLAIRPRADLLAAVVMTAAFVIGLPRGQLSFSDDLVDSRNRFARWADANLPEGSEVVLPDALGLSRETLPRKIRPRYVNLADARQVIKQAQPGRYMLVPAWSNELGVAEQVAAQAPGMAAIPPHKTVIEFAGWPAEPAREKFLSSNPSFKLVRFQP